MSNIPRYPESQQTPKPAWPPGKPSRLSGRRKASLKLWILFARRLWKPRSSTCVVEARISVRVSNAWISTVQHRQHALIRAYGSPTLSAFVLDTIKRIKSTYADLHLHVWPHKPVCGSSDLETSLIMVPFGYVVELLAHLVDCVESNRNVELACRCAVFLVKWN